MYDLKQSYADVFFVVGAIYVIDTLVFCGVYLIQIKRENHKSLKTEGHAENIRISSFKTTNDDGTTPGLQLECPVPATMATSVQANTQQPTTNYNPFQAAKKNEFKGYSEDADDDEDYGPNDGGGRYGNADQPIRSDNNFNNVTF